MTTDGTKGGRCRYCGRPLPTANIALPGHRPRLVEMPCDCEEAKAETEREERERIAADRAEKFREVWGRCGVPEEFKHVKSDFAMAERLLGHGAVYLFGKTGRGKTYRACQYAKGYLIRSIRTSHGLTRCTRSLLFLEAESVQSQLRSTWGRWDQSEDDLYQRWIGVDLLVFDDLGKGNPDVNTAENVFRIIRKRQEGHKETIFTSQYSTSELVERFSRADERTIETMKSRLRGWCEGIVMEGPDRRRPDPYNG